ncbi:MAG TPA: MmgE/PrpD family protein, partial [Burkholderiales bacterium]|nr:MmgE/PrpD family protein [Burkholderiales bacterium]
MLTERFARSVLETRDIPAAALDAARDALLDTLGCALAGSLEHTAEIAQQWIREAGARPVVSIWGTPLAGSPMDAAFANGIAVHALDFDDSLPTLRGHPSATIVPASIAAGELAGASGKAVLEAIAIGVEVAGIVGQALGAGHYMRGWHTTATGGVLAATAAAARVLGLTVEQLQRAWGLAASQAAGLVRNFGTMTKPFHAGNAARSALNAVMLARAGFTASTTIFDGKNNYFDTYGGDDREPLEKVLAAFGQPWQIVKPGIYVKRWPCCYCNHRPVGGMLQLIKEHQIKA